jgi:hypothetical protein
MAAKVAPPTRSGKEMDAVRHNSATAETPGNLVLRRDESYCSVRPLTFISPLFRLVDPRLNPPTLLPLQETGTMSEYDSGVVRLRDCVGWTPPGPESGRIIGNRWVPLPHAPAESVPGEGESERMMKYSGGVATLRECTDWRPPRQHHGVIVLGPPVPAPQPCAAAERSPPARG